MQKYDTLLNFLHKSFNYMLAFAYNWTKVASKGHKKTVDHPYSNLRLILAKFLKLVTISPLFSKRFLIFLLEVSVLRFLQKILLKWFSSFLPIYLNGFASFFVSFLKFSLWVLKASFNSFYSLHFYDYFSWEFFLICENTIEYTWQLKF